MERKYLIAIVAVVAVVVVAAGVLASGILNPANDPTVIKYTNIAPKDQSAAIRQGTVDGGVSWEPYVSDSVLDGTGHVLLESGDYWPNHPCCVVAFDKEWAAANSETAQRFVKAHIVATEWIQQTLKEPNSENYTKLMEIGAAFSNRNVSVVAEATKHMQMEYNISDESRQYFQNYTQEYMNLGLLKESNLNDNGYSNVSEFVQQYVNTGYMEAAAGIEPVAANAQLTTVRVGFLAGDLHQFARVVAESTEIPGFDGKSIFATYGIQTTSPQPGGYAAGGNVMDAFNLDQIDVGYLGSPPAIMRHLQNGIPTEIVALANTEGSAIVVRAGIDSIADLGGKFIASPGESSIQYLLLRSVAEQNGLTVRMG
jgi:NitT/TauT family transport system substrate-binding protein